MNGKVALECAAEAIAPTRTGGKGDQVRHVFENAPRYLKSRRVDIRFRVDTVGGWASAFDWRRLLDIGCGDGTISLQLAASDKQLTLMDLSSSMVERAKSNIPAGIEGGVEVRNENFADAVFGPRPFDLIVTVGVMAHVDSPDAFLRKIKQLLPPGGTLILEFTDAFHIVGRIGRFWGWLKELVRPAKYSTNKLSYAEVAELFERYNFKLESVFRYSRIPLPGFNRIVSHDSEYKLVGKFFGDHADNRNAGLGNEYICLLKSE